jgi:hypothetical protein
MLGGGPVSTDRLDGRIAADSGTKLLAIELGRCTVVLVLAGVLAGAPTATTSDDLFSDMHPVIVTVVEHCGFGVH